MFEEEVNGVTWGDCSVPPEDEDEDAELEDAPEDEDEDTEADKSWETEDFAFVVAGGTGRNGVAQVFEEEVDSETSCFCLLARLFESFDGALRLP